MQHSSAFGMMNSLEREGLVVASRRNALKASLAGLCGLSFPEVLRHRPWQVRRRPPKNGAATKRLFFYG